MNGNWLSHLFFIFTFFTLTIYKSFLGRDALGGGRWRSGPRSDFIPRWAIILWCYAMWWMLWCGAVQCSVVWCGVVWCDVAWRGAVWYSVVWRGVAWCGVMLPVTVWRHSLIHYWVVHITVYYSNAILRSNITIFIIAPATLFFIFIFIFVFSHF